MEFTMEHYEQSVSSIRSRIGPFQPEVFLVLGSGLGFLADELEGPMAIPYADIPHFRASTAPGHCGRLVFGTLEGKRVMMMQGRTHYYEGYSFQEITFAVRVAKLLGAASMIVTNACGCVRGDWRAGTLMLIRDHIKLCLDSPLRGTNLEGFGPRFPDASEMYSKRLQRIAQDAARDLDLTLKRGVYMYFPGPQYETPAEVHAARLLGADAVGMSTVPEVIVARHCGMEVLGISLLTNMASGILPQPLSEQEVLDAAAAASGQFSQLVRRCLGRM